MHHEVQKQISALGEQIYELSEMMYEPNCTTSTLRMMEKLLFDHAKVFKEFVDIQEEIDLSEMEEKVDREFYA